MTSLDVDYDDLMKTASPVDALPLPSTHPHYILYTSGTTGLPKGVLRDTGGNAVALKYSMDTFYNARPGDVYWAASDIGWAVGHSYLVYGPLLHGCTTIMYEGKPVGTPDEGAFWRMIEEYKVKTMFTAPTAFRAIKQVDPEGNSVENYDLTSLENLFLAGEHSDPETIRWLEKTLSHLPPPIDHWWQTELGWPAVGNSVGLGRVPIRYGSCSMPVNGFKVEVFDEGCSAVAPNELGNMVLKLPLPPGSMKSLYLDEERYVEGYLSRYPGYYDTGDAAFIDEDGYISIMGRTDDTINVAGHRLSTGAMEEILLEHPKTADCAVIPVKDKLKGQLPFGFVVCSKGTEPAEYDQIRKELVAMVREKLGPVAAFKNVAVIDCGLPKTRSGKILRGMMAKIANGEPYKVSPTIEDESVVEKLAPHILDLVDNKKL
uniref:AMP-dependent synthetase/ligase domain-containing protein n=1 Tax=Pseudo-nitzschia delicatissima TaxID=44447 RepID=A0A7S0UJ25_9STRA|mmetsp:Transcript_229/g.514  ORF Transcript_229/g.514 Transcript_229/m.514 type:complete len:431 (+) Transcript_229:272-1564(+)